MIAMDRLLNVSGRNSNLHSDRRCRPFPVVLALHALAAAGMLCGSGAHAAAPNADGESRELRIVLEGTSISARTPEGRILFSGRAGQDDAAIVQRAVDHVHPGGEIRLAAGTYRFAQTVRITNATTLSGAGKSTVIVPPADDYALVVRTEDNSPRRWYHENVLNGVTLRAFTIDGQREDGTCTGKGIHLQNIFDSHYDGLWIANTGAGPGLCLDDWVGESNFTNIHLMNCGSLERREAAVLIRSSQAGPCNNLQFRGLYVIFPRYRGLDIQSDGGPRPPKLIFVSHSMFHGWIPGNGHPTAPADLVHLENTDKERGVVFDNCRLTAADRGYALLKVVNSQAAVTNSVIGAIGGRWVKIGIQAETGSRLSVRGNTFHEVNQEGDRHLLLVKNSEVLFTENEITGKAARLSLVPGANSIIANNIFRLRDATAPIIFVGDDGQAASRNIRVHGNVYPEGLAAAQAIAVSALSARAFQPP
jgi:hypothetical protein